jgi:urocanate hydratase
MTFDEAVELRRTKPSEYVDRSRQAMAEHCQAMLDLQAAGAVVFDYGNGLRGQACDAGVADAFGYPGFVLAYIRPLFSRGAGPFRWACLSGDPADLAATDQAVLDAFPDDDALQRWVRFAAAKVKGQGLPSRICWVGYGERHRAGLAFDELVAKGVVSAPIAIGRDHLDAGSVASPERETEGMRDGSDAIADWPLLNAMLNTASGASWVSIHHGGGVGIGKSVHAGQVVVAEGTELSRRKVELVLTNDPATGVIRHADAGYDIALDTARDVGVRMPLEPGTHAPAWQE